MAIVVVGASGATGRLVVQQLLENPNLKNETIKVIIRSKEALVKVLPIEIIEDQRLEITEASLLDMTEGHLAEHVKGCRVVISCLGHNLSFRGIYGKPRRLVTDALKRLCKSVIDTKTSTDQEPTKIILMNTTGNQNKRAGEKISRLETVFMGVIRMLLPPHADNEDATEYLQSNAVKEKNIAWVAVRPDSLVDEFSVTDYEIYPSPIRSAIFDAGKVSRIDVAHFMTELALNNDTWQKWQSQMPVIYSGLSVFRKK